MQKTQNEMITALYTVTMGVPNTDDRGIVGDVKDIKREQKEIKEEIRRVNGCVGSNTAWRKAFCFIIPMLAGAIGFLAGAMFL